MLPDLPWHSGSDVGVVNKTSAPLLLRFTLRSWASSYPVPKAAVMYLEFKSLRATVSF